LSINDIEECVWKRICETKCVFESLSVIKP